MRKSIFLAFQASESEVLQALIKWGEHQLKMKSKGRKMEWENKGCFHKKKPPFFFIDRLLVRFDVDVVKEKRQTERDL